MHGERVRRRLIKQPAGASTHATSFKKFPSFDAYGCGIHGSRVSAISRSPPHKGLLRRVTRRIRRPYIERCAWRRFVRRHFQNILGRPVSLTPSKSPDAAYADIVKFVANSDFPVPAPRQFESVGRCTQEIDGSLKSPTHSNTEQRDDPSTGSVICVHLVF